MLLAFAVAGCGKDRWKAAEKKCLDDKSAPAAERVEKCAGICGAKDRYPKKIKRGAAACKMVKELRKRCVANNDQGVCEWICKKDIHKPSCKRAKLIADGTLKPK